MEPNAGVRGGGRRRECGRLDAGGPGRGGVWRGRGRIDPQHCARPADDAADVREKDEGEAGVLAVGRGAIGHNKDYR